MQVNTPTTRTLIATPTPLPSPESLLSGNPVTADDTHATHMKPEAAKPISVGLSTEIASDADDSLAQRGDNVADSLQPTAVSEVAPNHAPADIPPIPSIEPRTTLDSSSDADRPQNPNASPHTSREQPSSAHEEQSDTMALSVNNFALRACHLRTKLKSCFRTTPMSLPDTSSPEAPPTDTPSVEGQDHSANIPAASEASHQEHEHTSRASSTNADDSGDHVDDKPHAETPSNQPNAEPAVKHE
jgi:hypothetical protein